MRQVGVISCNNDIALSKKMINLKVLIYGLADKFCCIFFSYFWSLRVKVNTGLFSRVKELHDESLKLRKELLARKEARATRK